MQKLFTIAPIPVICALDPAIDIEATGGQEAMFRFMVSRDPEGLKYHSGQTPTVYWVRRLPQLQASQLSAMDTKFDADLLAAIASIVKVDNFTTRNGDTFATWSPAWKAPGSEAKSQAMTPDEIELFTLDELRDVGSVALARANLRPGRLVYFAPPQSSLVALGSMIGYSRHVGAASNLPQEKHEEPSKPQV